MGVSNAKVCGMRLRLTRKRLLVVLMVASATSALLGQPLAARLRPVVQVVLMPFGNAGMYLTTAFRRHLNGLFSQGIPLDEAERLNAENQRLRDELGELRRKLMNKDRQLSEIPNFCKRYGPDGRFPWELIPARVVMTDSLPYGLTRVLSLPGGANLGTGERVLLTDRSKALLARDPAAVCSSALAGRVIESSAYTARLQLLTDRGFRTKARILRDATRTPRRIVIMATGREVPLTKASDPIDVEAYGDGASGLIVENVREYHNVKPGDHLVTCDDEYFLPAAVPIGEVTDVRRYPKSPGFVQLRVKPRAELASLRDVYIVVPPP